MLTIPRKSGLKIKTRIKRKKKTEETHQWPHIAGETDSTDLVQASYQTTNKQQ